MINRLRAFFTAPRFADEDQTQAASKLHFILWTLALSLPMWGLFSTVALGEAVARAALLVLAIEALVFAGHLLNRAGRVRWASGLLVIGTWLILTSLAATAGGVSARAAWGYFIVVFVAGVTLGNGAGLVATIGCSLTALGLALASLAGWLPPTAVSFGPLNVWATITLYLGITAGLQYLASRFQLETLQRARRELVERQRAEAELRQKNRALITLSACNQALVRLTGEAELMDAICRACVRAGGYRMAWVGWADADSAKSVRVTAQAGFGDRYLEQLRISWDDGPDGQRPASVAIRTGRPEVLRHLAEDPYWNARAVEYGYGAVIGLPLRVNGQVLGALTIFAAEPDAFDPDEMSLLAELAGDLAFGIETLRTRAEHARVAAALEDSEVRFRSIFENSRDAIGVSRAGVFAFVNPTCVRLFGCATSDDLVSHSPLEFIAPGNQAAAADILRRRWEGQDTPPLYVTRGRRLDGSEFDLEAHASTYQLGGEKYIVTILRDITERTQAEAALKHYADRMAILHEIDRGILAAHSVAHTTQAAVSRIRALVACDRAGVVLTDPESPAQVVAFRVNHAGLEPRPLGEAERLDLSGAFGRSILPGLRQGQAVAIEDLQALDYDDAALSLIRQIGMRGWLILPLLASGELMGALSLSRRAPGAYSAADRDIAREVADQLAIAIQQARLLAETREALQREQRLNEVARIISTTLDWQTVVQTLMRLAAETVNASGSLAGLLTAADQITFFPSFFSPANDFTASHPIHQSTRRGEGLVWQLIETRQPMRLDDYSAQPGALPYLVQWGAHALLGVPLIAGERVLGGLAVFDRDPRRRFSARDQATLESIGRQAGLAIENARLFEAERAARLSADALVESAQVISSALSLPEVLNRILLQVKQVLPAITGSLSTETAEGFKVQALLGYEGREGIVRKLLEEQIPDTPHMQQLRRDRCAVLVPDVQADPNWVVLTEFAHVRCFMAAPIQGRQGLLGVLTVDGDRPHVFNEQHMAAVKALAAQAGIAIENARLFEATGRQLADLVMLHAGAVAATEATNEDALIERATQIIRDNLSPDLCGVALVDDAHQMLYPHASMAGSGHRQLTPIPLGYGIVGGVALTGQARRIGDTRLESPPVVSTSSRLAELCVPLRAGERIVGALDLESNRPDAFSAADERLLVTFAGLLGTAIVRLRAEAEGQTLNKRLEQRVAARTRELTALYDVSEIASQLIDLPSMIARALGRVLEVVDSQAGAVFLLTSGGLTVQQGLDAAVVNQLAQAGPHGLLGQVVAQGQPVIWPEAVDNRLLCVGLPMNVNGAPVGVLSAMRETTQPFNVEELALLASTADALAIAIENARLRQQAEETAVAVERERLARDLHDSVTQGLYSLTLFAEAGRRLVRTEGKVDTLEHYLNRLGETAHQALKDMRLLIHNLRPAEFAPDDLIGALQQRLEAVERRSGVEAGLVVTGQLVIAPAAAEALYRIAQEALNNSLKHSAATVVRVRLYNEAGETVLEVSDNGRGFEAGGQAQAGGMGLRNMQVRAQQLGGRCDIRSKLGAGTIVVVTVPEGGH